MSYSKRLREIVILFLFLLMISANALAENTNNDTSYSLIVEKDLISLNAKDASLKAVLEDIGQKIAVEVVNIVPAEEKVSVKFERLPLKEAIKRLSSNYVYLMDSKNEKGNITKIVVLSKGSELAYSRRPEEKAVRINSSQTKAEHTEKSKQEPLKDFTKKESVDNVKKEKPKSRPFMITFDPSNYLEGKEKDTDTPGGDLTE